MIIGDPPELNLTDVNPLIFTEFYFCCEKVNDNKEFSCGNSKPRHESQITTC